MSSNRLVQVKCRQRPELLDALKRLAASKGRSLSGEMTVALQDYLTVQRLFSGASAADTCIALERFYEKPKGKAPGAAEPLPPKTPELEQLISKIEDLNFPPRVVNFLRAHDILRVGDLVRKTEAELRSMWGCGALSLKAVKLALAANGFQLGTQVEDWPPANVLELERRQAA